ncbi:MAG: LPS export ABC transporter periplasmic protein LptC [Bryobacteraceae bacterium]|nr:LPS export ABC transporter periplasmic protein LptC [Bryobacteraceae bacterium]
MRRTRPLLLLGVLLIVSAVAGTYYFRKSIQEGMKPPAPPVLPLNVNAEGKDWVYTHYEGNRPVVEVRAQKMRQVQEPSEFELERVELRIFDAGGGKYDHVRSAFASFDTASGQLYSEGEVEITLGLPADGAPPKDPVTILSSGVHFEAATGKATTERRTRFRFGRGAGEAVGASYDPRWHDLRMHSDVKLRWAPEDGRGKAMTVEAGELVYKEDQSKVYFSPWSRFQRDTLTLNAANSVVTLENDRIKLVDADAARGTDRFPGRNVDYAASHLTLEFTPKGEVSRVVGEDNASITSTSDSAVTKVSSERIYLNFEVTADDSTLKEALAMGGGVLETKPADRADAARAETRVMRSEVIKTLMRPGGREVELIETLSPGTIEFRPNREDQKRRKLEGERIWLHYGAGNRLQTMRALNVSTQTDPLPQTAEEKNKKARAPMLTWSQNLLAEFDPSTTSMTRMEQSGDFRYEEGERKAKAAAAELNAARNMMALRGQARVWDEAGATAAEQIFMDQKEETVFATGQVSSTRLPDPKRSDSGILSESEPFHATADRMSTSENNAKIIYEGNAVLWQGSNRLQAQRIEIRRQDRILLASGQVVNQVVEAPKKEANGGGAKPTFMLVRSQELHYDDNEGRAQYRTGVAMTRGGMEVTAAELNAFFAKTGGSGAELERAIADGQVKIVQRAPERTRTGTAEHAEYYVADEKVLLRGGKPKLVDSLRGATEGRELTYFARNDKLLVNGAEDQRAVSQLQRN